MLKPVKRLISAAVVIVLTIALVIVAKQWTGLFFQYYPEISRKILLVISGATSVVPFAIWEFALIALVLWFLISMIVAIHKGHVVRWLTGVLLTASLFAFLFVAIWGLNYFAPPMSGRVGLKEEQYTKEQLKEVTIYYRDQANLYADSVKRDAEGLVIADFDEVSTLAGKSYDRLAETMDCFNGSTVRIKKLLSSRLLGATGTTGIFICFTGESGVCDTVFSAAMPFTMAHEIGHRMAFARENEANFAAYLACSASDSDLMRYSGNYMAFIYCYNALYDVDRTAAAEVAQGIGTTLAHDLDATTKHYASVENETAVSNTNKVYSTYLQVFDVTSGVQSYGEVVDLLSMWYMQNLK